MRRIALMLLSIGVTVSATAAAIAAAPEEEELFDAPKMDTAKREHPVKPDRKASETKAHDKTVLGRMASKAMASARHRMVTKAPPRPPVQSSAPSFYAGIHFGGGWSHFGSSVDAETASGSGVIGGGQFGWNYRSDDLVFGVKADISASGVRDSTSGTLGGTAVTGSVRNDWFVSLAGRYGHAWGHGLA
jgi:hypothetical protein